MIWKWMCSKYSPADDVAFIYNYNHRVVFMEWIGVCMCHEQYQDNTYNIYMCRHKQGVWTH